MNSSEFHSHGSDDAGFIAALDAMPIPAIIAEPAGGPIRYVNPLAAATLGEPAEKLLGRRAAEFATDSLALQQVLDRLEAGEHVQLTELTAQLHSGRKLRLLLSFKPIKFNNQDCFLVSGIDISELRRVQEQLRTMLQVHERERRWLGLEIHDGLVQNLTGSLMFVESIRTDLTGELDAERLERAKAQLNRTAQVLQETILDARGLINGLRPPVLEQGLSAALENLCQEMAYVTGAEFRFEHSDPPQMNANLQSVIYRIAQEALANVRKHSEANTVELELQSDHGALALRVSDDGRGVGTKAEPLEGVGLGGIRERVQLLGGEVAFDKGRLGGFELRVRIPLE